MKCIVLAMFVIAFSITGCGYFRNLGYDASEIVQAQVGSGKGAAIDAYGAFLLGVGMGQYQLEWIGYGPRYIAHCRCGRGTVTQEYIFLFPLGGQCEDVNPQKGDLMLPGFMAHNIRIAGLRGYAFQSQTTDHKDIIRERLWRIMDFGFTFVPLNYGIRMDISPGKALDCLGSILFLDLEGDNIYQINGKINKDKYNLMAKQSSCSSAHRDRTKR